MPRPYISFPSFGHLLFRLLNEATTTIRPRLHTLVSKLTLVLRATLLAVLAISPIALTRKFVGHILLTLEATIQLLTVVLEECLSTASCNRLLCVRPTAVLVAQVALVA